MYHKFLSSPHGGEAIHNFDMSLLRWLRESGKGAALEREFIERTREGDAAKKNIDEVYDKWFEGIMKRLEESDIDPLPRKE